MVYLPNQQKRCWRCSCFNMMDAAQCISCKANLVVPDILREVPMCQCANNPMSGVDVVYVEGHPFRAQERVGKAFCLRCVPEEFKHQVFYRPRVAC